MAGPKRTRSRGESSRRVERLRVQMGQRLRQLRGQLGLTREQLAEDAGVSYDQLTKLESARGGGSFEVWMDLADAVGATFESLVVEPTARGAADVRKPYDVRGDKLSRAEVDFVAKIISDLDRETATALMTLARRLRRQQR